MAHALDAVCEKFALLELEGHTVFHKNVANVEDALLVRLGGEDNRGSPGAKTFADPTTGF